MSAGWPEYRNSAAGFTLLELLLVLSILALLTAIAVPLLTSPSDGVRLRSAGEQIAAALRLARAGAIARNGEVAIVIETESRTIHQNGSAVQKFASDIFVQLTIAESERATPTRGGFRFFADGSSTGGDILLRLRERELRLCVDWLTGKAGQGAEC
jgi:general secretion pathway protein H